MACFSKVVRQRLADAHDRHLALLVDRLEQLLRGHDFARQQDVTQLLGAQMFLLVDRPVDLLDDGFDLVVRTGALADEVDLKARRLGSQAMVLCASPSYLQMRGAPLRLEDIASHDALAYGKGNRVVPWRFTDRGRQHEIKTTGRIRFDDLESIADAATGGCGLA